MTARLVSNRWLAVVVALVCGAAAMAGGTEAQRGNGPEARLPRLVDLGAGKCIPCRMMMPILEELRCEYAGEFEVVFIDVWENREASARYRIRVIPTQIFLDAEGNELFRHEGFWSKAAILAKWRELGVALTAPEAGSQGGREPGTDSGEE